MEIKQAVILAGGLGKRLAPFTDENPKPMYPIHGIPFIEYLIRQIKSWGIEKVPGGRSRIWNTGEVSVYSSRI